MIKPGVNLTSLFLDYSSDGLDFCQALNQGLTPNVARLGLSLGTQDRQLKLEKLRSDRLSCVDTLILHKCLTQCSGLMMSLKDSHAFRLRKLDISHSSGKQEICLYYYVSFPSLSSLILSNCGLNSQGLHSLSQASVMGKLPQLTHLDISRNLGVLLVYVFCSWNSLLKSWESISIKCHSFDIEPPETRNIDQLLTDIADAVELNEFPAPHTVCAHFGMDSETKLCEIPATIRLMKANVSVHASVSPDDTFTSAICICQLDTR